MAVIAGVFFVFVQLAFLEGATARIVFTVVFAVFLLAGGWMSMRSARTWPQEVRLNDRGISYGSLRSRHGVDIVPWQEVAKMDLFRNQHNMAPFLRIGLRSGPYRARLRRPALQGLSLGLDVNIPMAVDADPEEVLAAARRLWEANSRRPRGDA